jgi:hypothetical protein
MIQQKFLKKEIFKSIKMKILQIISQRKMKLILGLLLFTFATLAIAGGNPYISNAHQGSDGSNRRDGSNKNTYDSQYGKKNQNDYLDQNQHQNFYNQDRNDREAANNYRQNNNVAEKDYKKRNIHANEVDDTDAGKYKLKFNKDHQNKNERFKNTKYQDNVNDLYSTDNDHVNKYSKRNHQKSNDAKNSYADHAEADDNVHEDQGIGQYGGYGKNHGGARNGSSKKHQQRHKFGNNALHNNENDYDENALNSAKKISLNKIRRGVAFEDTKAANDANKDSLYFDTKNEHISRRNGKYYNDDAVDSHNKYGNSNVDKNNYKRENYNKVNAANQGKKNQRNSHRNENNSLQHGFQNNDHRQKAIERNEGFGGYDHSGYGDDDYFNYRQQPGYGYFGH